MNLIARLKGLRRSNDEKLAEETLEGQGVDLAHAAGVNPGLQTGLVREADLELEHAEEHEEPQ
jgi:hypothetical protein